MNKVFNLLIVLIVFLLGIQVGTSYVQYNTNNELFEVEKNKFEEEIIKPNNQYEPKQLIPKKHLPNKIADKISNILDKISNYL